MVLLSDLSQFLQVEDREARLSIGSVSWEDYESLLNDLGDSLRYRVCYLDGVLELLSPSRRHESSKTNIGSLLEDYFKEKRIRYFPLGSTTFRQRMKKGGLEPDESYCIHTEKEFPDLAIEIVVTNSGINKLEIYRRLGVREVWFFKTGQFEVHHLLGESYVEVSKSQLLLHLDLVALAQYAVASEPLDAALEFREKVKEMLG
jgi:Uma2 family endonuclease